MSIIGDILGLLGGVSSLSFAVLYSRSLQRIADLRVNAAEAAMTRRALEIDVDSFKTRTSQYAIHVARLQREIRELEELSGDPAAVRARIRRMLQKQTAEDPSGDSTGAVSGGSVAPAKR